ncbi:hypothetical protein AXXA_01025 [Achromobacter insuavis AXX-A]|uniref:Uncharacterized protein n=1 Tax=Achromobacter insuavis AXX-A TaxID=1003200 RepID=F7SU71_9BURK|nr:hypothetical protein AXXA_01025 [Achromobacter insuavis AXX-A]
MAIKAWKVDSTGQACTLNVMATVLHWAVWPPEPLQAHGALVVAQATAEPVPNTLIAALQAAPGTSAWPAKRAWTAARAPSEAAEASCCCIQNSTP